MKIKKFLFLMVLIACLPAFCLAADPVTLTQTETATWTITETSTITPTATITQTYTSSPTPQASVFAYPNPAAYRDTIFVAYPKKAGYEFKRVIITIYGANGDYVSRITDDFPNGYTEFDITKLARGTYIYKVFIRYQDGTEETFKYKKFAIIK